MKIKDKKTVNRWSYFIENQTQKKCMFSSPKTKSNISDVASNKSMKMNNNSFMSPEVLPSRLLSPPLYPQFIYPTNFAYFQGILPNFPMTPVGSHQFNLLSNYHQQINNNATGINPGLINPLNHFRPKK